MSLNVLPLYLLSLLSALASAQYTAATYNPTSLPPQTEGDQFGTNQCGGGSRQDSLCQNVFVNSVEDFCLWGPPYTDGTNSTIGETEPIVVSWCLKSGYGTRLIPDGTIAGAHFVQTPDYVQVTGFGDLTKLNIPKGDAGGELDPHGADGTGNPKGGLVFGGAFGRVEQYHEWTSFMAYDEFCIKACRDGPNAPVICNHVYDIMGCAWNVPGNYDLGTFTNCDADSGAPMGVYGSSTWDPEEQHRAGANTPPPHPAPSSSNCRSVASVSNGAAVVTASTTGTASSATQTSRSSSTSSSGSRLGTSRSSTGTTAASRTSTSTTASATPSLNAASSHRMRQAALLTWVVPALVLVGSVALGVGTRL